MRYWHYPRSVHTAETRQLDVRLQKTFDYAIDVTRQLLTLGTAVLALTLTLGKDGPDGERGPPVDGLGRVSHTDDGVRTKSPR
jgi:hypothetical protein